MVGLRHGRAAAVGLGRWVRATVAALVAAVALGVGVGSMALAASPPPACASGITSANQLAAGNSCQLPNGSVITGGSSSTGTVNYGTPNGAVQHAIVTPMENWAATLRLIIVALALVIALIGLILRNMHHNPQLAQTGSRMITMSLEGVAVVVFLPFILNLIAGFNVPILP